MKSEDGDLEMQRHELDAENWGLGMPFRRMDLEDNGRSYLWAWLNLGKWLMANV